MAEQTTLENRVENIENRLKVDIINGKKTKKWVNEVVEEIWNDIEIIRDANKIHKMNKKYKIYWLISAVAVIFMGSSLRDVVASLLKELAK